MQVQIALESVNSAEDERSVRENLNKDILDEYDPELALGLDDSVIYFQSYCT